MVTARHVNRILVHHLKAGDGDCCEGGKSSPGCENMTCQDEICFDDSVCCAVAWDDSCAEAANIECGICGGGDDDDDDDVT